MIYCSSIKFKKKPTEKIGFFYIRIGFSGLNYLPDTVIFIEHR